MPAPKGDEAGRALAERAEELARRERKAVAELEEIRATIVRLRSEREAKIAEFRALTRPGSRAAPDSPAKAPAAPHDDRAHDAALPAAAPVTVPEEVPVIETPPLPLLIAPRAVEPIEPPGPTIDLMEPVEAPPAPAASEPDETVAVTPTVPDLSGSPPVPLALPELPEFVNLPPDLPSAIELGEMVALTVVVPDLVEPPASPIDEAKHVGATPLAPAETPQPADALAVAPAEFVAPDEAIPGEPGQPVEATVPERRLRFRLPRVRWTVSRRALTVAAVAATGIAVAAIAMWSPWSRTPQGPGQVARPRQSVPSDNRAADPAAAGAMPRARVTPEARPRAPLRALDVRVVTSRPVWIRAIVDGRTVLNDTVVAGETITLEGDSAVTLRLGDAGAVGLWLNGENLGRAGRDGEVLTRRFDAGAQSAGRPPRP